MRLLGFAYLTGLILTSTPCRYYLVGPAAVMILLFVWLSGSVNIPPRRMIVYLALITAMISSAALYPETIVRSLEFILPGAAGLVVYEAFTVWRPSPKDMRYWLGVMALLVGCGFIWPIFSNRNTQGLIVVFLLYLFDEFAAPTRWLRRFAILAAAIAVTVTLSRASALLLAAYLILAALRNKSLQATVFVAVTLLFILTYITGTIPLPNLDLFGRSISYTSGRDIRWQGGLELVRTYPFGMGYANYSATLTDIVGSSVLYTVHNVYLSVAAQFGVPFLALCVSYLCWLFGSSKSHYARAIVLGAYIHGFFESGTPFGYSPQSAILVLPLYLAGEAAISRGILRAKKRYVARHWIAHAKQG